MRRRALPQGCVRWAVLALACLTVAHARAAVLIEAELEGTPIRLELGLPGEAVRGALVLTVDGRRLLIEPELGHIEPRDGRAVSGSAKRSRNEAPSGAELQLQRLPSGAVVAGHAGFYHLALFEGRICGEVLAAPWMVDLLRPAAVALDLLVRFKPELSPQPRHGCPAFAFREWAKAGWPLLVSGREVAIFRTRTIRFDHPLPPELRAVNQP